MWSFEKKTLQGTAPLDGPMPKNWETGLWIAFTALFTITAWIFHKQAETLYLLLAISPIMARLIAQDLCHLILLNIYVAPLLLCAFLWAYMPSTSISLASSLISALVAFITCYAFALILEFITKKESFGGGDLKFITVAGAFVGVENFIFYLWITSAIAIALYPLLKASKNPNKPVSFGPPLIIALWLHLIFPNMIENLIKLAIL